MTLALIDDHVEEGLDRLLQRSRKKYNIDNLLSSIIYPIQEIENENYNLYTERSLDTAQGKQLDGIGKIVGLSRDGKDDIDYRAALIMQIQINKSGGEPESIIAAIRQLFRTEIIKFKDLYPANFEVHITSETIVENAKVLIDSISPAGVGSIVLLQRTDSPFCLSDIEIVSTNYSSGIIIEEDPITKKREIKSYDLGVNNSDLLQVTMKDTGQLCNGYGLAEVFIDDAFTYSINGTDTYSVGRNNMLDVVVIDAIEDYKLSNKGGIMPEVLS